MSCYALALQPRRKLAMLCAVIVHVGVRALVRLHLSAQARRGYHYGMIARFDMADAPFAELETLFQQAIEHVHNQFDKRQEGRKKEAS